MQRLSVKVDGKWKLFEPTNGFDLCDNVLLDDRPFEEFPEVVRGRVPIGAFNGRITWMYTSAKKADIRKF